MIEYGPFGAIVLRSALAMGCEGSQAESRAPRPPTKQPTIPEPAQEAAPEKKLPTITMLRASFDDDNAMRLSGGEKASTEVTSIQPTDWDESPPGWFKGRVTATTPCKPCELRYQFHDPQGTKAGSGTARIHLKSGESEFVTWYAPEYKRGVDRLEIKVYQRSL